MENQGGTRWGSSDGVVCHFAIDFKWSSTIWIDFIHSTSTFPLGIGIFAIGINWTDARTNPSITWTSRFAVFINFWTSIRQELASHLFTFNVILHDVWFHSYENVVVGTSQGDTSVSVGVRQQGALGWNCVEIDRFASGCSFTFLNANSNSWSCWNAQGSGSI